MTKTLKLNNLIPMSCPNTDTLQYPIEVLHMRTWSFAVDVRTYLADWVCQIIVEIYLCEVVKCTSIQVPRKMLPQSKTSAEDNLDSLCSETFSSIGTKVSDAQVTMLYLEHQNHVSGIYLLLTTHRRQIAAPSLLPLASGPKECHESKRREPKRCPSPGPRLRQNPQPSAYCTCDAHATCAWRHDGRSGINTKTEKRRNTTARITQ